MPTKKSYDQYRERPKTRKKNLLNIHKGAAPCDAETTQILYNLGDSHDALQLKKHKFQPTSEEVLPDRSSPALTIEPPAQPGESPPPSLWEKE
jgi:hypothetical protein